MIEQSNPTHRTPRSNTLNTLLERATLQRSRYKQFNQSLGSVRASVVPSLRMPLRTLRRVPARYLIHTVVAAALPVALGLSQVSSRRAAQPEAPPTALADMPVKLGPIHEGHFYDPTQVGDPPLKSSDAIPMPISLTSRSEALAPVSVVAAISPDAVAKLRGGPGLAYDEVRHLTSDNHIEIIGRYGDWFQLRQTQQDTATWVAAEFVDIPEASVYTLFEIADEDIPPPPPPKVGSVRTADLNLRDGPGTEYVTMMGLEFGQEMALVEQYQDWVYVATDHFDGWVNVDHLDIADGVMHRIPVAEQIPDANPPMVGVVTANSVNLRKGPGTAYATVGTLSGGEQVDLLAYHGEWFRVAAADGTTAWLFGDLVNMEPMVQRRVAYTDNIPSLPLPPQVAVASDGSGWVASTDVAGAPIEQAAQYGASYEASAAEVSALGYIPASGDVAGLALQFVGSAYVYGGASPGAFDCSGLVTYTYSQYGVYLPHNAAAQWYSGQGVYVESINHLVPGDLVFFAGTSGAGISHVGIYVGGGRFVHAMMPGLGVQVSDLWEPYWLAHYYGAMRVYR